MGRIRLILLGAGLVTVLSPMLQSAPCVTGASLASYIALGSGGCTLGEFTFKNFGFAVVGSSEGPALLSSSAITVTTTTLSPRLGVNFFGAFSVTGIQSVDYSIGYTIDPPPPILRGFALDLFTDTPVAPGTADVFASLCVGAAFSGAACSGGTASAHVFHYGSLGSSTSSLVAFAPSNILGVQLAISLKANGASSSFTGIGSSAAVPEPSQPALLALALLSAWIYRRRREHAR